MQVTLALSFIIQSALLLIYTGDFQTVHTVLTGKIVSLGPVSLSAAPVLARGVAVILAGAAFYVIGYTDFGRKILAVTEDSEAASLSGVNVRFVTR